jgi:rRNA maturation protein Nop10
MNLKKKIKNLFIKRKELFPCKNCLVSPTCNFSKPCDKLEMDNNKLKELFLKYKCCPDCGSKTYHEGPAGGASINIQCDGCGHNFNMALPLFVERINIPGRFSGEDRSP